MVDTKYLFIRRNVWLAVDRACSVYAQLGVFALALCVFVLAPPRHGPMLLISSRAGLSAVINLALTHGSTILSKGPIPGSVIVDGDRSELVPVMMAQGTFVLAATPLICGVLPERIEDKIS